MPVGFLAAITRGQRGEELTEMGELADTGAVAFSDDGVPVAVGRADAARAAVRLDHRPAARAPLRGADALARRPRPRGTRRGRARLRRLPVASPSRSRSSATSRSPRYESGRIHVLHLSAAESVDALRRAREAGVAASGEATPHHLVLTDDAVRSLDPNVKMNPPLRAERDRVALLDAVRDGTIEAIATDHAPHAAHEKDVPFEAAPFGVTGLETAFASLYTHLVQPGLLPLETLLERMSAGPARIFGLDRPRVADGATGEPRPARPRAASGRSASSPSARARATRGCSARGSAARCG